MALINGLLNTCNYNNIDVHSNTCVWSANTSKKAILRLSSLSYGSGCPGSTGVGGFVLPRNHSSTWRIYIEQLINTDIFSSNIGPANLVIRLPNIWEFAQITNNLCRN